MGITIRKMREADHAAAMDILRKWNMAPVEPTAKIKNPERSELNIKNSFVALNNDEIIGVCSYILHSAQLAETASLAINPGYRGKSIGFKLQQARLAELKKMGIRTVRTETDREETVNWYLKKFGYRKTGTNPKKHDFSLPDVCQWTVLELDLEHYEIFE